MKEPVSMADVHAEIRAWHLQNMRSLERWPLSWPAQLTLNMVSFILLGFPSSAASNTSLSPAFFPSHAYILLLFIHSSAMLLSWVIGNYFSPPLLPLYSFSYLSTSSSFAGFPLRSGMRFRTANCFPFGYREFFLHNFFFLLKETRERFISLLNYT